MPGRLILLACAVLLAGCAPQNPPAAPISRATGASVAPAPRGDASARPAPAPPDVNTDPCAMRLHDISGAMLLYFSQYQRLPAQLAALRTMPGFESLEFTCPASGAPYAYTPAGVQLSGRDGRIYVCDSNDVHGAYRWGIEIIFDENRTHAFTNVIPVLETQLRAAIQKK